MRITLVVAMDRNRIIGRDGRLPWKLPRDLKRFREVTWGHPIVMGRKTYESIGHPLPGRTNIILTRQPELDVEGCCVVHSIDEALGSARIASGGSDVMIVGGADLFRVFLPVADRIHLTRVETQVDGDTVFPGDPLISGEWSVSHSEDWPPDERNPLPATYLILDRCSSTQPDGDAEESDRAALDSFDPAPSPRSG